MKLLSILLLLILSGCTTITPVDYADHVERQDALPEAAPATPFIIGLKTF